MRDVSLPEVLNDAFNYQASKMYTAIPCIVLTVHTSLTDCRIDVQPSINTLYKNDVVEEHPPILSVPVMFPSSSTSALTFPINVGDTVLCVFSQKGIDNFKKGSGSPTRPVDFRRFDKRDAIAIPGLFPFGKSVNNPARRTWAHSTSDMVVAHNLGKGNEVEVRLHQNGNLTINTNSKVTVNCNNVEVNSNSGTFNINNCVWNGAVTFNGNITHNGVYSLDGITMNSHRHTGIQPGSGTTGTPV